MLRIQSYVLLPQLVCIFFSVQTADVIPGDPNAPTGQSFSFPVGAHVLGNRFHVGAKNQLGGLFSIARVNKAGSAFEGLTPEQTTLNGKSAQLNPLFNAKINFLKLLNATSNQPVAVTQTETDLFLVQDGSSTKNTILSLSNIRDAGKINTTAGIVGLETDGKDRIIAAIKGNGEVSFGTGNSGITLIGLNLTAEELIGTNTLLGQFSVTQLNTTTNAVKISSDLTAIGNIVDIHWSSALEILYIGLQTESGALGTDGSRSVVAAHFENNAIIFTPIAPDSVFTGASNKIVGAVGGNELVSIHKIRTMQTSQSLLTYLIVLGGNGSPATTQNVVFALPVVNTNDPNQSVPANSTPINFAIQGTLANINQPPVDLFSPNGRFLGREFQTGASDATQVFTNTDAAAQVGGGVLPAGSIEDLFVIRDTVFVTVGTAAAGQLPGIFYSEALLDDNGVIISWTAWQRVAGTTDQVFGGQIFFLEGNKAWDGSFIFMTGPDANSVQTVKKTLWSSGAPDGLGPLTDLLSQSFAQEAGGIRGLNNFPKQIAALNEISLLVATGRNRVALVESGRTIGGIFTPNTGEEFLRERKEFDTGTIEETFLSDSQTRYVQLSGGVLATLGPITASEIASDDPAVNGWLFVGGMAGLAVLTDANGSGWNSVTGALTNGFYGLTDQMSFKSIGNYTNVRKITSDQGFLYILTDTTFDRINLQTSNFGTNTLDSTTLATLQTKELKNPTLLLDAVVSEKIALLSTSVGSFRIGNGKDVTTAQSDSDIQWTELALPNSVPPVLQLFAISTTGLPQDISRNGGGMIYALNAYAGFNQGKINRIAIGDTTSSTVNDDTIIPFNDLAFENLNSFYRSFPGFRELTNVDGSILLSTQDKDLEIPAQLFAETGIIAQSIPLEISDLSSDLVSLIRSYASGSWLVAGDFGLRVNQ